MSWLAALLALWTAIASAAPVASSACESPRCTCCARDSHDGPTLQRPPCCARDDATTPAAAPVLAPRSRASGDDLPAIAVTEPPRMPAGPVATDRADPDRSARGPPKLAPHLRLGRMLL